MVDFSVLSGRAFFFFCSLLSVAAVAACSRHWMSHPRPPFGGVCLDDGKDRHFYVTHLLWRISHHTNTTTITILPAVDLSRYRKRIPATQPVPLFICVFALFSPFTRGCSITTGGTGDDGDKKKQKGGSLSEERPRKRADLFSSYFSSMSLLPVRANEIYCHNRSPHGGAETAEG